MPWFGDIYQSESGENERDDDPIIPEPVSQKEMSVVIQKETQSLIVYKPIGYLTVLLAIFIFLYFIFSFVGDRMYEQVKINWLRTNSIDGPETHENFYDNIAEYEKIIRQN